MSVAQVLVHFLGHGEGLWVNERRMKGAIDRAGFYWSDIGLPWPPEVSVVWVQGLGSWMRPSVP